MRHPGSRSARTARRAAITVRLVAGTPIRSSSRLDDSVVPALVRRARSSACWPGRLRLVFPATSGTSLPPRPRAHTAASPRPSTSVVRGRASGGGGYAFAPRLRHAQRAAKLGGRLPETLLLDAGRRLPARAAAIKWQPVRTSGAASPWSRPYGERVTSSDDEGRCSRRRVAAGHGSLVAADRPGACGPARDGESRPCPGPLPSSDGFGRGGHPRMRRPSPRTCPWPAVRRGVHASRLLPSYDAWPLSRRCSSSWPPRHSAAIWSPSCPSPRLHV